MPRGFVNMFERNIKTFPYTVFMKIYLCSSNCVCFGIFSKLSMKCFFNIFLDVGGFSLKCDVSFKEYLYVSQSQWTRTGKVSRHNWVYLFPVKPQISLCLGQLTAGGRGRMLQVVKAQTVNGLDVAFS
jgi:hypothetical protein